MQEETTGLAEASSDLDESRKARLVLEVQQRAPLDAVRRLEKESDRVIAEVLADCEAAKAIGILARFSSDRILSIKAHAPAERQSQWTRNESYPEDSVGRFMDPPVAILDPDLTVETTIERLRELARDHIFTYGYVVDGDSCLLGVVVMRDLLLAGAQQTLAEIMVRDPFRLESEMSVAEAIPQVLNRHYPVYPVCDSDGRIAGVVPGHVFFEEQALELSAQPGRMVGVEDEERVSTPWWRCLRFRHPWLQLNLLTAFVAASVVGFFQQTIDQIVLLAVFLPVLAGQSGNTGLQALAVTLRGMTLGDLDEKGGAGLVFKEGLLGLLNGAVVGITAGAGMYLYARMLDHPKALLLAGVVFLAMVSSCALSGLSGSLIPIGLRRLGVDPATASSIFLTTLTDLASMGLFLWLATLLLL